MAPGRCRQVVQLQASLSASTWSTDADGASTPRRVTFREAGFRRALHPSVRHRALRGRSGVKYARPGPPHPRRGGLRRLRQETLPPSCERGVRVETDLSDDRFGKKIHQRLKDRSPSRSSPAAGHEGQGRILPYRDGSQHNGVAVDAPSVVVSHTSSGANNADRSTAASDRREHHDGPGAPRTVAHRGRPRTRGRPGRLRSFLDPYRMAYIHGEANQPMRATGLCRSAVRRQG